MSPQFQRMRSSPLTPTSASVHERSPRLLLLGFLPMLIGSISVWIINLTPAPSALPPQAVATNKEIQYLYSVTPKLTMGIKEIAIKF